MRDVGARDAVVLELNFGGPPAAAQGIFTVTDARVQATSSVLMSAVGVAAAGRQADELEFEDFVCRCFPASGSFKAVVNSRAGLLSGGYKFAYVVR